MMPRLCKTVAALALIAGTVCLGHAQAQAKKVFYLLSHGGASDPFWVDWNASATKACRQLNVTCKISFSGGDMAAQKEAFDSALAAKPDGIATTSAQPGLWPKEVAEAKAEGIPVVFFNTDDPATGRLAYVGADLKETGVIWAKYLVDRKLLKRGDKVFMPVEVPGASYQQLETQGVASVLGPLGISYEVVDCGTDPAGVVSKMTDYLIAHKPAGIIALGDMVAANMQKAFQGSNLAAGSIPVVGWGNSKATAEEVRDGYVLAAAWQFPSAQGYMPVVLLDLAASGDPIGYDIHTFFLYDKSTVQRFLKVYSH
jgi:simple sugar transport system substrate-binding protein